MIAIEYILTNVEIFVHYLVYLLVCEFMGRTRR
nr:MAG TPA: hypothetical protein [Caudoviricetes sp.]